MAEIGQLNVTIGANTTGLQRGLSRAKSELTATGKHAQEASKQIAKVATAATAAGAAIVAFTQRTASNTRELRAQAQIANTTTQELQRLAHGARTVGVDQAKLADILKDVNDRTGDFLQTGAGEMVDFFELIAPKVGLTAKAMAEMSGPDALQAMFNALEQANLSMAETTFFMEALATESTRLIPLLRDGGAGFREMAQEADQLGIILSDLDLARLQDFSRQFQRITSILSGLADVAAAELSPFLAEIAERLSDSAVASDGFREEFSGAIISALGWTGRFLDAVEGVRRSFEVVGKAAVAMTLAINIQMAKAAEFIYSGPVDAVNVLINQMNRLPFTDIAELEAPNIAKETQREIELLKGALEIAKKDISETMAAPLPSQGIESFIGDVQERIDGFREKFESEGGLLPGPVISQGMGQHSGSGGSASEEDPEDAGRFLGGIGIFGEQESQAFIERLRAMLETRQEILREFDVLDEERQQEAFEREMERLREGLELKAITEQEFRDAQLEAERNYWSQRFGITQNAESGITALVDSFNDKRISSYATAFDSILNSLSEHSKAAFNIQKGLAIAAATIDAYEAITGAYKVGARIGGPPLGAAFAAAAGAAQFATIAKIASTQFNGGASSGGGSGGSASAGGGGGGGSTAGGQPAQEQQRENTIVTINIAEEGMFSGRQVRGLIESINDELDNGMRLRVR